MAITQDGRILDITTPLGKDHLLLQSFRAVEGISQLFSIEAVCLHEEPENDYTPTRLKPEALLAQGVHIRVQRADGSVRHFNGIVNRIAQGARDAKFTSYELSIVPQAWLLTQTRQSRIFQNMSTKDILEKVFKGLQITNKIQKAIKPRFYCVQYRETDWDFASRLMEEEGIYYYFEHTADRHRLVLSDMPDGHIYVPNNKTLEFALKTDQEDSAYVVSEWGVVNQLNTGKVTLWDHHFQNPAQRLEAVQTTAIPNGNNKTLEDYDYPGTYARWNDDSSSRFSLQDDAARIAEIRMQEIDGRFTIASGSSEVCSVTAGHRFELEGHPNADYNRPWMITQAVHNAEQSPTYHSEDPVTSPYTNSFSCVPYGQGAIPFRPERRTPKPIVHGSHTAFVVGSPGEEITTDKYGRVKVQFHWDREGKGDANSSCWVRVAQGWAGRQFGTMFLPRVGMQVVVDFFEGDPDQPIITGFVHNADAVPAYALPDNKTRSYIKTNSVNGSGFNEIRIEDKSGSEQIFIHAQRNKDVRVKKDLKETIEQDRHLLIKRDQFEKVEKDKHLKVRGDHSEQVDGKVGIKVGTSMEIKTGTKFAAEAGTEVHIKAGTTAVIEAGASLTLKVGGNSVAINSGGVFIKGTMVHLNSMAAATSGSGSNPTPPQDAQEADDDNKGKTGGIKPQAAPPPPPVKFEKLAQAARQSAASSSPSAPSAVEAAIKQEIAKAVPLPPADAAKSVDALVEEKKQVVSQYLSEAEANALVQQAVGQIEKAPELAALQQEAQQAQQAVQSATKEAQGLIGPAAQEAKARVQQAQAAAKEAEQKVAEVEKKVEETKAQYEEAKQVVAAYEEAVGEAGEEAVAMAKAAEKGIPFA